MLGLSHPRGDVVVVVVAEQEGGECAQHEKCII